MDYLEFSNDSHIQKLNPVHISNLNYINDVKRLVTLNKKQIYLSNKTNKTILSIEQFFSAKENIIINTHCNDTDIFLCSQKQKSDPKVDMMATTKIKNTDMKKRARVVYLKLVQTNNNNTGLYLLKLLPENLLL